MEEEAKGHCKHGEFILADGCPECIAERRSGSKPIPGCLPDNIDEPAQYIVKVAYYSETKRETSKTEYSYLSVDDLKVGEMVIVPVKNRDQKAIVTAVNVPESDIEAFRDVIKTIPAGSRYTEQIVSPELPHGGLAEAAQAAGAEVTVVEVQEITDLATIKIAPSIDPRIIDLKAEIDGLVVSAESAIIIGESDVVKATNELTNIAVLKKSLNSSKEEYVKPIKGHLDSVNSFFKVIMEPLEEANTILRKKVLDYRNQQEAKARERDRIAQEERKLAEQKAALEGIPAPAPAPVPTTNLNPRTQTDIGETNIPKITKFEVVDFAALPDEYKTANTVLIGQVVRSSKGKVPIPGVRIWQENTIRVSGK
jgi:nitrogen regulatory protein PII-like uncharacterized protein